MKQSHSRERPNHRKEQRQKVTRVPESLAVIAARLNAISTDRLHRSEDDDGWAIARAVITDFQKDPEKALVAFNNFLAQHHDEDLSGFRMVVRRAGDAFVASLKTDIPPLDEPIRVLWEDYFGTPHRDRLKRCRQCSRWFVDRTKNKSQENCLAPCTSAMLRDRRWTKAKRKEAGFRSARKKTTSEKHLSAMRKKLGYKGPQRRTT